MLGPKGTPLSYYHVTYAWDNYTHTVMNAIMTWIADALVIYRCYIIWGSSPYQRHVIILPVLLLLAAMGVNTALMVWFGHPFSSYEEIKVVLNLNYPLFFAQNVTTTGLIASKAAGILTGHIGAQNRTSLLTIARIIVESAALYTFEIALLDPQYIVRSAIIPTIGIVFVLIAIRVHAAREGLCSPSHCRGGSSDTEAPVWALNTWPVFKVDTVRSSTYSQDTLSPGMDREEDDYWKDR
ncbi:hypothetical protein FA13DRAFT_1725768 [Coprinellus micaceus]|uniref:Uncharacterized protein n=1 Tax=Coprinellus micaceus TaxID=71717 RepID=A0A4Y7TVX6_COPMI|nr:hypothetical protein FA13DRAFT_1725768 [Coprinellus micaceus]